MLMIEHDQPPDCCDDHIMEFENNYRESARESSSLPVCQEGRSDQGSDNYSCACPAAALALALEPFLRKSVSFCTDGK